MRESSSKYSLPCASSPEVTNFGFFADSFAREDEDSPRQDILAKFCLADLKAFRACMSANGNDENKCLETKGVLDGCAKGAFKEVNSAGAGKWVY